MTRSPKYLKLVIFTLFASFAVGAELRTLADGSTEGENILNCVAMDGTTYVSKPCNAKDPPDGTGFGTETVTTRSDCTPTMTLEVGVQECDCTLTDKTTPCTTGNVA